MITVVVVTFNSERYIADCLDGLLATAGDRSDVTMVVVDNASRDGTVEIVRRYPAFELVVSPTNAGYSSGIAAGYDHRPADILVVLNPDLRVSEGWLEEFVGPLADPSVGATTGRLLLASDPSLINALGQDIHWSGLGFNRRMWKPAAEQPSENHEVDGVHGAAFAVRGSLWEKAEPVLRPSFLYHEDVELSWLVRLAGYRIVCTPAATLVHDYVLDMTPRKFREIETNRVRFMLTVLRPWTLLALLPVLLAVEGLMLLYGLVKGPSYLVGKVGSLASILTRPGRIMAARRDAEGLRAVGDWQVLRRLTPLLALDQLLKVSRPTRREGGFS
ncbi:MAG: glycosyltransferase [Dehalococcoidia bacterium]|nr:glycosyltransferase [Dehalococcoidia bacterium]